MQIKVTSHFQLLFVLVIFLNAFSDVIACELPQSFERARGDSAAIFLGTAVEERRVPMATKGGTAIHYKEVKFDVTKSWKLVDRKTVWIRVPAAIPGSCGYDSVGFEYLVYANLLNDIIYISPMSRTMHSSFAKEDIERLGVANIHINSGEYYLFKYNLVIALFLVVGVLLVCGWLLILYRRPTKRI